MMGLKRVIEFDNRCTMLVFKNWHHHADKDKFWHMIMAGFEKDLAYFLGNR